jgi:hypothetical protein
MTICNKNPVKEGVVIILTRIIKIIRPYCMFFGFMLAALLWAPLPSAQTLPSKDQWGEKFNSPGAKLTYKEIGRTKIQGRTVITSNLFASGFPKDEHYVLYVLNLGSDPRADAYLNGAGKGRERAR